MVDAVIIATIFLDHFTVDALKEQPWPPIIWPALVSNGRYIRYYKQITLKTIYGQIFIYLFVFSYISVASKSSQSTLNGLCRFPRVSLTFICVRFRARFLGTILEWKHLKWLYGCFLFFVFFDCLFSLRNRYNGSLCYSMYSAVWGIMNRMN